MNDDYIYTVGMHGIKVKRLEILRDFLPNVVSACHFDIIINFVNYQNADITF